MGTPESIGPHFGEAPVQNLALRDQFFDCTSDVLDRNLRVDAVLIYEVDPVGPEPLEHTIDSLLNVFRTAVETRSALTGFEINVPSEL
jgi:hypothetical protein